MYIDVFFLMLLSLLLFLLIFDVDDGGAVTTGTIKIIASLRRDYRRARDNSSLSKIKFKNIKEPYKLIT